MVTKGYIIELPKEKSNIFKVRLPVFETGTSGSAQAIYDAVLCYSPGLNNEYKVGDCIFCAFEDNDLGSPIILGKLYLSNKNEGSGDLETLRVSHSVDLPSNTRVGGKYIPQSIKISDAGILQLYNGVNKIGTGINIKDLGISENNTVEKMPSVSLIGVSSSNLEFKLDDNTTFYFTLKVVGDLRPTDEIVIGYMKRYTYTKGHKEGTQVKHNVKYKIHNVVRKSVSDCTITNNYVIVPVNKNLMTALTKSNSSSNTPELPKIRYIRIRRGIGESNAIFSNSVTFEIRYRADEQSDRYVSIK